MSVKFPLGEPWVNADHNTRVANERIPSHMALFGTEFMNYYTIFRRLKNDKSRNGRLSAQKITIHFTHFRASDGCTSQASVHLYCTCVLSDTDPVRVAAICIMHTIFDTPTNENTVERTNSSINEHNTRRMVFVDVHHDHDCWQH